MVSVIVPVYNVEKYLARCIDSILAQTYQNLEIILVDDGSPDGCGKICDAYAQRDNRVVVIHKENGGLSSARNAGIEQAKGEFIAFVDSDDWLDCSYVEKLRTTLVETNADMAACMFCRVKNEKDQRKFFNENIHVIEQEKYVAVFSENSYAGYACNKLFKSDIIKSKDIRFDEKIFNGEDFPFVLEYVHNVDKIVFIKQDLYFYFFRETGIMNSIRLNERFVTIIYAREKALEFSKKYNLDCYDLCKATYLSILSKIKYMSMFDLSKHKELYLQVDEKIKQSRKGLFLLKKVGVKEKVKLCIMIYFPKISAWMYKKKIKVET